MLQHSKNFEGLVIGLLVALLIATPFAFLTNYTSFHSPKELENFLRFLMGLLVFIAIVALTTLNLAFKIFKYYHKMEDLPTAKIKSCAQGVAELEGIQLSPVESKVISKLSNRTCTWYKYTIEELQRRYNASNQSYEFRWQIIESFESTTPLLINDGTGICSANPINAEIVTNLTISWKGYSKHPGAGPNKNILLRCIANLFGKYKYRESYMLPNSYIYALGNFKTINNVNFLTNENLPEDTPFLLSAISQHKLIRLYKFKCIIYLVIALLLPCLFKAVYEHYLDIAPFQITNDTKH